MTDEAQNAFLKLLEEPPSDTLFLLTSSDVNKLLSTVISRVQRVTNNSPGIDKLEKHFQDIGYKEADIKRALSLSNGLPGLAAALLENDEEHHLAKQLVEAKKLLSSTVFDRLVAVNNLSKNKDDLPNLLLALRRICRAKLIQAAKHNKSEETKTWHNKLSKVVQIETLLERNPQPKLLLTDLLINL